MVYLGLNTIRSLALSVGILAQYDQKTCASFSLDALATHSWTTGVMARGVAQMERSDLKVLEQCFLAGLLHDIGQLILAFGLREEYSAVLAKAQNENRPVWQVEQEFFGATHADVGAYLLALWGLPDPIVIAVAMHHKLARCPAPEFSTALAVHVADVFAHENFTTNTEVPPPAFDTAQLTSRGFGGRLEAWREGCRELINQNNI